PLTRPTGNPCRAHSSCDRSIARSERPRSQSGRRVAAPPRRFAHSAGTDGRLPTRGGTAAMVVGVDAPVGKYFIRSDFRCVGAVPTRCAPRRILRPRGLRARRIDRTDVASSAMLTRLAVCGGMACARLAELAYARRNLRLAGPTEEGPWSRRTYPLMI